MSLPNYEVSQMMQPPVVPPYGFEAFCQESYVAVYKDMTCTLGPTFYNIEDQHQTKILTAESSISCCQVNPSSFVLSDLNGTKISCLDTSMNPDRISAPLGCPIGYLKDEMHLITREFTLLSPTNEALLQINLPPERNGTEKYYKITSFSDPNLPTCFTVSPRGLANFHLHTTFSSNLSPLMKVLLLHTMLVIHYWEARS